MESTEVGDLINFLRSHNHHDMADWVAVTAMNRRSPEEAWWIARGCPPDDD